MQLPAIQKSFRLPLLCAAVHSNISVELSSRCMKIVHSQMTKKEPRRKSDQCHYRHLLVELHLQRSSECQKSSFINVDIFSMIYHLNIVCCKAHYFTLRSVC